VTVVAEQSLQAFPLITGLVGGLALFLYGMDKMATALKAVAGERMKTILSRLTSNRFAGVLTGALVTAVIQSSSVTTVLVVGFVAAGLMSLAQSVGVIMGANIGTTLTAQVMAFKVTEWALVMIAVGFAFVFVAKTKKRERQGAIVLGLGLVFFGMNVMGEAMAPLRSYAPFLEWMTRMEQPLFGIAAGALFTALIQSSSATTGIAIVMAGEGLITLPAGIALIFGANIGTCVTAALASVGKSREATRAAIVHGLFNFIGVMIWFPAIPWLAEIVCDVSPSSPQLGDAARLAAETPRQIANAHSIFNVANTCLMIGFAPLFARAAEWFAPDRPIEAPEPIRPRYLDEELISTPALALDRSRLELLRQGELVQKMLRHALPAVFAGDTDKIDALRAEDDLVDHLHGAIVTYLGRISQGPLDRDETRELMRMMECANDLESVGDIVARDLSDLARKRIARDVTVSDQTKKIISAYHADVERALSMTIQAVTQKNASVARLVVGMKPEMKGAASDAFRHEATRLVADEPNRLAAYRLETDLIESLGRVYYFAKRMARGVIRK